MQSTPWPAPYADAPVRATVRLPGSKSLTNRALVLAALARSAEHPGRPAGRRDTALMAAGLRALGVDDRRGAGPTGWSTPGAARRPGAGRRGLRRHRDAVPAPGRRPRRPATCAFDGDPQARAAADGAVLAGAARPRGRRHRRPAAGCRSRCTAAAGCAAARSASTPRRPRSSSPRCCSPAPRFDEGVDVRHDGSRCRPAPHIEMTVAMLRDAGAIVEDVDDEHLAGRAGAARRWTCCASSRTCPTPPRSSPRPWSPAAGSTVPRLAAAHHPGRRRAARPPRRGWAPGSTLDERRADRHRPGRGRGHRRSTCTTSASSPRCSPPWRRSPTAPSTLRGIAHLRGHETDRLAALATELTALGGDVARPTDGLHRPARDRCTAASSRPTTTTGWPRRPRSSGCASRASWSRTSPRRPRRCPASSTCGPSMLGRRRREPVTAAGTSTRTTSGSGPAAGLAAAHQGPAQPRRRRRRRRRRRSTAAASPAGSDGHEVTAMKARELGRAQRRGRRPGRAGRRHLRRRRTRWPGSSGSSRARPRCAAPPTTPTRSSGSSSPTPTSSSSSPRWPTPSRGRG